MKKDKSAKYCGNIDCSQGYSGRARKYKHSEEICSECKSDLYVGCYKCGKEISDPSRKYCRACQDDKDIARDGIKKKVSVAGAAVLAGLADPRVRKVVATTFKLVVKK